MRIASILAVLSHLVLTQGALAADRWVNCQTGNDANAGISGAPWRTIQHAANMANPGDIVHVTAGPCTEPEIIFGPRCVGGTRNRQGCGPEFPCHATNTCCPDGSCFAPNISGPGPDCIANPLNCTVFRGEEKAVEVRPASDKQDGFRIGGGVDHLRLENFSFVPNNTAVFNEPFRILGGFSTDLVVRNVAISGPHESAFKIWGPTGGQPESTTKVLIENTLAKGTEGNGYQIRADKSTDDPSGGLRDLTLRNARAIGNVDPDKPFGDGNEVDGFAIFHGNPPAVSNVVFDHTLAADNAEDGYDVAGNVKLFDVRASGNGSAGVRAYYDAQIENAHIVRNWGSGIRTVGPEPDDGSRPTVDILGCTLAHNASRTGAEVNLASKRSRVRVYNNIFAGDVTEFAEETGVIEPLQGRLSLQYSKQQDLQLEWDHNLFWRNTTCSPTQSCGGAIRFTNATGQMVTCEGTSAGVKNCDGSHANSEYGAPAFESFGLRYLAPGSPGIDLGLSQPTFL